MVSMVTIKDVDAAAIAQGSYSCDELYCPFYSLEIEITLVSIVLVFTTA